MTNYIVLSAEDREKIQALANRAVRLSASSAHSGLGIFHEERRIKDDGPGKYVTLVGDVWPIRKFKIRCEGCENWIGFLVFLSGLPHHEKRSLPRFCETCCPTSALEARRDAEYRAKAFETRCKNLGITQEEAHARRAKALGLDGMV